MGVSVMLMEQIYLYTLLIIGASTILYVFFADIAEGIGEGIPFFNPSVILAFVTFTSATGYLLEVTTLWNSFLVMLASIAVSVIADIMLYFFVLLPMSSAEVSIAYTDESLAGQVAKVITPIPTDGFGEILIHSVSGMISKRATGYDNEEIGYGKEVLVIDVKEGTFLVREYEVFDFISQ
jgi:membrane-bound ClpP family serine protease